MQRGDTTSVPMGDTVSLVTIKISLLKTQNFMVPSSSQSHCKTCWM